MKVVVGASTFADSSDELEELFSEKGIELVKNPYGRRMTQDEIIMHLQGADGLLAGLEPLNEEVFQRCPSLKAIARIGIGMDNVDIESAKKHHIKVSNTPNGPTDAVAEMTIAALLAILHQIIPADQDVHNGIWKKRLGKSISECTVLIIGYGHIGKKTAERLSIFGAKVLVYDKFHSELSTCNLEEGLRVADVVSLHASGREEILGKDMLNSMKNGAILLNSARGALVNEQALYDALQAERIAAFWGDALWEEPYQGILTRCENAILTPHICTYTNSCRTEMERQAVKNLMEDLGV